MIESPKQFFKRRNIRRNYGGFPHHHHLKDALAGRGFEVRMVEKFDEHPAWCVYLRPGTVVGSHDTSIVRREVACALQALGYPCRRRDISAMATTTRLVAAFIWENQGKPGRLLFDGRNWKEVRLYEDWPYE